MTLSGRLYRNAVRFCLIPISATFLHYVLYLSLLYFYITSSYLCTQILRHHVVKQNLKQCPLHIFTMPNESKTSVKQNILRSFSFQELQVGTGMDQIRSAWKLLHIKIGLSPFLLMNLYLILHYNSCTLSFSKHSGRIE